MLPMPKYKNHVPVDQACGRERHGLSPLKCHKYNHNFLYTLSELCDSVSIPLKYLSFSGSKSTTPSAR